MPFYWPTFRGAAKMFLLFGRCCFSFFFERFLQRQKIFLCCCIYRSEDLIGADKILNIFSRHIAQSSRAHSLIYSVLSQLGLWILPQIHFSRRCSTSQIITTFLSVVHWQFLSIVCLSREFLIEFRLNLSTCNYSEKVNSNFVSNKKCHSSSRKICKNLSALLC